MCVIWVPVRSFSSSPARWPGEPLPTDANEIVFGFAFAAAISSATVLAGNCGFATRICGSDATVPTGSKSLRRVERQLRIERRVDRVRRQREQHRVAVGRRLRDDVGAERAGRAAAVVDHDRLAERMLEAFLHDARDHVGAAAGRVRHDELDRLVGEGALRVDRRRDRRECREGERRPA
jgi:hypothetical protein